MRLFWPTAEQLLVKRLDVASQLYRSPLELLRPHLHPAGRSLNSFWRESVNRFCHTEELLPAAILVITRVTFMKIGVNLVVIRDELWKRNSQEMR